MTPTSRRAVLGAGAWTAPAIVLANAAPAYAGSTATPALVTTAVSAELNPGLYGSAPVTYLDITCVFTNQNSGGTTGMSVIADVEPVLGQVHTIVVFETDPGWAVDTQIKHNETGLTATFNRKPTARQLGASPDSISLFFRVWMETANSSGIVRVRPTPQPLPATGVPGQTEWSSLT